MNRWLLLLLLLVASVTSPLQADAPPPLPNVVGEVPLMRRGMPYTFNEYPFEPVRGLWTWDWVGSEALMWGGVLADGAASMRWVGDCRYEGNPLFQQEHNALGFRGGRYFAINGAISAAFTVAHIIVRRKAPEQRLANGLMDGFVAAIGAPHWVAAGRWANDCF